MKFFSRILFASALLSFNPMNTSAQGRHQLDSLLHILNTLKEDTTKANALNTIANDYVDRSIDSGMMYALQALTLSRQLKFDKGEINALRHQSILLLYGGKSEESLTAMQQAIHLARQANFRRDLASCLMFAGYQYSLFGMFDSSGYAFDSAIAIFSSLHDKASEAKTWVNKGTTLRYRNDAEALKCHYHALALNTPVVIDTQSYSNALQNAASILSESNNSPKALEFYLKAKRIYEVQDKKLPLVNLYSNIGSLYLLENNYEEARRYYELGKRQSEQLKYPMGVARSLEGIAGVYAQRGEYVPADSIYKKALEVSLSISDKSGAAAVLNNMAEINYREGKYALAKDQYTQVADLSKEILDSDALAQSLCGLGEALCRLGKFDEGVSNLKKGIALMQQSKKYSELESAAYVLADIYKQHDNYKDAYQYLELAMQAKDSTLSESKTKEITTLALTDDFDKQQTQQKAEQDKKDALAGATLKSQTTIRNVSLLGLTLALLVALLLFNQFRSSQKSKRLLEEKNKIIEQEKNRAEQSEQFKSRFLANMSHEIRTPMNAVIGMTNLVLNSKLDEQQAKYMNAIRKSSRNLLVIINDILDLSKIEAGKMELEKVNFRLSDVLDNVYDTLRFRAEEKSLKLVVNVDDDVPKVLLGDAARLNQILINVVGNAVKFTEKGSVTLEVGREKSKVKGEGEVTHFSLLTFHVTDTGIGIPADKLQQIFEGFSQAEKSTYRQFGGTGLGLNISKQLVELQEGTIEVASEAGRGSTFTVSIPFETGDETAVESKRGQIDQAMISRLKKIKILLAEDNLFNQIVAEDSLKMKIPGIHLDIAQNGKEALEKIKTNHYDIVLMDVHMPEMNGLEAMQIIRSLPSPLNHLKVIAMTASVTKAEIDACYKAGMDDYVPKPFEQNELVEKIAKLTLA